MPKLQIFLPRECCTMETKATDLAGEAVREEYVSGGQVSVDKVLPGQVTHPRRDVFPKLYEQLWSLSWD